MIVLFSSPSAGDSTNNLAFTRLLYYWKNWHHNRIWLLTLISKGHQYSKVRRALHSSHPDNLLCREKETAEIRSFLHNHLPKGKPGSLYISGAPGTGKTACLTRIMLEMKVNEMTMIKCKESYWCWLRLIMYICYMINTWMVVVVLAMIMHVVINVTGSDVDVEFAPQSKN